MHDNYRGTLGIRSLKFQIGRFFKFLVSPFQRTPKIKAPKQSKVYNKIISIRWWKLASSILGLMAIAMIIWGGYWIFRIGNTIFIERDEYEKMAIAEFKEKVDVMKMLYLKDAEEMFILNNAKLYDINNKADELKGILGAYGNIIPPYIIKKRTIYAEVKAGKGKGTMKQIEINP